MLTEQNASMKDETILGLRTTKAELKDYHCVQNAWNTLDMIKVVKKSNQLCTGHLRWEAEKKSNKEGEKAKAEA